MFTVKIAFAMIRKKLKMLVYFCLLRYFHLCNTNTSICSEQ